jgi:hypothetical protein
VEGGSLSGVADGGAYNEEVLGVSVSGVAEGHNSSDEVLEETSVLLLRGMIAGAGRPCHCRCWSSWWRGAAVTRVEMKSSDSRGHIV